MNQHFLQRTNPTEHLLFWRYGSPTPKFGRNTLYALRKAFWVFHAIVLVHKIASGKTDICVLARSGGKVCEPLSVVRANASARYLFNAQQKAFKRFILREFEMGLSFLTLCHPKGSSGSGSTRSHGLDTVRMVLINSLVFYHNLRIFQGPKNYNQIVIKPDPEWLMDR